MSDITDPELQGAIEGLRGSIAVVVERVEGIDSLRDSIESVSTRLEDVRVLAAKAASGDRSGGRLDDAVGELAGFVRSLVQEFNALKDVVERKEGDASKLLAGVVDALHDTADRMSALDRVVRTIPSFAGPGGGEQAQIAAAPDLSMLEPLQNEMSFVARAVVDMTPMVNEIGSIQRTLGDLSMGLRRIEDTTAALGEAQIALATRSGLASGPGALRPKGVAPAGEDANFATERLRETVEKSAASLGKAVEWLNDNLREAFEDSVSARTAPLQRSVDLIRDEIITRLEDGVRAQIGDQAEAASRALATLRDDTRRIAEALVDLSSDRDGFTQGLRTIEQAQSETSQDLARIAAAIGASYEAVGNIGAEIGSQLVSLKEAASKPAVAPETLEAISRIERALTEAHTAISAVSDRMPADSTQGLLDLTQGLAFVATRVDELTRMATSDDVANKVGAHIEPLLGLPAEIADVRARVDEITRIATSDDVANKVGAYIEPLLGLPADVADVRARVDEQARAATEREHQGSAAVVARIDELVDRIDAQGSGSARAAEVMEGWVGDFRATTGDLLEALEAIRAAVERESNTVVASGIHASLAVSDEILAAVGNLTLKLSDLGGSSAANFEGIREALHLTSEQVAHRLEALSTLASSNETLPAMLDRTVTQLSSMLADVGGTTESGFAGIRETLRQTNEQVAQRLEALSTLASSNEALPDLIEGTASHLATMISGISGASTEGFGDVRASIGELTEQVASGLEMMSAQIASSRDAFPSMFEVATERMTTKVEHDVAAIVEPRLDDLREKVSGFQDEVRRAFIALRDDVTGTVQGSVAETATGLATMGTDVSWSREALNSLLSRGEQLDEITDGLTSLVTRAQTAEAQLRELAALEPASVEIRHLITTTAEAAERSRTLLGESIATLRIELASELNEALSRFTEGVQRSSEAAGAQAAASLETVLNEIRANNTEIGEGMARQADLAVKTVRSSLSFVGEELEVTKASVADAAEVLRAATVASHDSLNGLRAQIEAALADQRGAHAEALSEQLQTLSSMLDHQRGLIEHVLNVAQNAQASVLTEHRQEIASSLYETRSVIGSSLEQNATEIKDITASVSGSVEHAIGGAIDEFRSGLEMMRSYVERSSEGVLAASREMQQSLTENTGALQDASTTIAANVSTATSASAEEFRSGLNALRAYLDQTTDEISRSTTVALDELRRGLEVSRDGLEQASAVVVSAAQEIQSTLSASKEQIDGTLEASRIDAVEAARRHQAELAALLERTRDDLGSSLDHHRLQISGALDATASDLQSHAAASRDDLRAGVEDLAAVARSLPELLQPAAAEVNMVAVKIERALDITTTALRQSADEGAAYVARTIEETTERSQHHLSALSDAVNSVISRVGDHEQAVTGELMRMGEELPRLTETVVGAVGTVAASSSELDRRVEDFVSLASNALSQFSDEVSTTMTANGSHIDSRITAGMTELSARIDERARAAADELAATREALEARFESMAEALEARLGAMHDFMAASMQSLAEDSASRMEELVAQSAAKIDATLEQVPTTEEVTQILHERAAGALRSVRRRLVRMDEIMTTLANAEGSIFSLADRVASLEGGVRALPSADDVADVLLSSKRGLMRRRAAVPARTEGPGAERPPIAPSRPAPQRAASPAPLPVEARTVAYPTVSRPAADVYQPDDQDEILSLDLEAEHEDDTGEIDVYTDEDVSFLSEEAPPAPKRPTAAKSKTAAKPRTAAKPAARSTKRPAPSKSRR